MLNGRLRIYSYCSFRFSFRSHVRQYRDRIWVVRDFVCYLTDLSCNVYIHHTTENHGSNLQLFGPLGIISTASLFPIRVFDFGIAWRISWLALSTAWCNQGPSYAMSCISNDFRDKKNRTSFFWVRLRECALGWFCRQEGWIVILVVYFYPSLFLSA